LSVPGIASVVTFGGEEKIFEIKVNPSSLINYGISPLEVYEAVERSNINVGGDVIQKGNQAYVVRGIGLLESVEDIENLLIDVRGDAPIKIKQVAEVSISSKPRLGQVGFNDEDDVVQGIVVMLRGENPSVVIKHLKEKIEELNERILPKNVKVVPFLDRTKLVSATIKTVLTNLIEGVLLVSLIVLLFLFNWRSTIIVASVIPFSFLFAMIMLDVIGMPANLISLGSLDFGLLLEGTLVIVEVIFVALALRTEQLGDEKFIAVAKDGIIKQSAASVGSNIFFAMLILLVALFPIFSFQKVEGKMFSPFAYTVGFALLGSLILSLTYVPVMCKLLLTKPIKEKKNKITKFFTGNVYRLYEFVSKHRRATIIGFCCLLFVCVVRFMF
jgi:cobalt-zinc-cadmium resistance protein CzcA